MPDDVMSLLNQTAELIEQAKTALAEAHKIDLPFHRIHDIRQIHDVDPAQKWWVVDYYASPDAIWPISWPWEKLTDNSKRAVLHAHLDNLLGEDVTGSSVATEDICEVLNQYFDDYFELIPEIQIQGEQNDIVLSAIRKQNNQFRSYNPR